MNNVTLKLNPNPTPVFKPGSIWKSPEGYFYVLAYIRSKYVAIGLTVGSFWDPPTDSPQDAVSGLTFVCAEADITITPKQGA